jgi:ubiquinone/menaquinone biosynthesis C-methylase UbiE
MPLASDPTGIDRLIVAYDRAAPFWAAKAIRLGYPAAYRWLLTLSLRDCPPPADILDVGCGTGVFAEACLEALPRPRTLTLVDPSTTMLSVARDRIGACMAPELVCAPLRDLPANASYDLILCAHVLDHGHDPVGDLAHLARLLGPSGRIILVHSRPHWCSRLVALLWHHHPRTPAATRASVRNAGLNLIADYRFPAGPPRRLSHAYVITSDRVNQGETP